MFYGWLYFIQQLLNTGGSGPVSVLFSMSLTSQALLTMTLGIIPMQQQLPGQGFRSTMVGVDINGNPADPTNPVVTVRWPDGTRTNPTPVKDSLGAWHADVLIPTPMPSNVATIQWKSSGAAIAQDAVAEEKFFVNPSDA